MIPTILLPDPTQLRLESLDIDEANHSLTLLLAATASDAACPMCGRLTTRIHSCYARTLADLPWADWPVHIQLQVRKFRCGAPDCPRAIFTERLPTIVAPWARRTKRLTAVQRQIGLTAGGIVGARLATALTMPVGLDTVLALVRQTMVPPFSSPSVLGIDDWAKRKGQTYGTILVDLTSRRPIDLLPERSTTQVAQWLHEHPGVSVISRDRGGVYAEAASQAAPDATQVADRWHIIKNLGEALLRVLQQQHRVIEQALTTSGPAAAQASAPTAVVPPRNTQAALRLTRREQEQQARQTAKQVRHATVQQLAEQGWSLRAIAAHTGLDRKTLRKYTQLASLPPAQPRGQQAR
jgi:transposase